MTRVEVVTTHVDGRRVRTVIRPAAEAGTYHEHQETPDMTNPVKRSRRALEEALDRAATRVETAEQAYHVAAAEVTRLRADGAERDDLGPERVMVRRAAEAYARAVDDGNPFPMTLAVRAALTPAPRDPRARAVEEILVDQLGGDVPPAVLARLADSIAHEIPS